MIDETIPQTQDIKQQDERQDNDENIKSQVIEQRRQQVRSDNLVFLEHKKNIENKQQSQDNDQKCSFCKQLKQKLSIYKQSHKNYEQNCEEIQQQLSENNKELIKVRQINEDLHEQNLLLESVLEENKTLKDMLSEQESFIKALKEQIKYQDQKLIQLQNQNDKNKPRINNQMIFN